MIREVTMYQPVCDGCGNCLAHDCGHAAFFHSRDEAGRHATLAFDWAGIDGKLYCPDCYGHDEETDEYKPKKNKIDYGSKDSNTRQL